SSSKQWRSADTREWCSRDDLYAWRIGCIHFLRPGRRNGEDHCGYRRSRGLVACGELFAGAISRSFDESALASEQYSYGATSNTSGDDTSRRWHLQCIGSSARKPCQQYWQLSGYGLGC